MSMIEKMEKKYGIRIRDDSYWDPFKQKFAKRYKIYTADGCPWENGLSFRGLQAECREYGHVFKEIAEGIRWSTITSTDISRTSIQTV